MKKFKKIIALAMTLAMMATLAIGLTALAEDGPPTKASITFDDDPRDDVTYKAFKIFNLTWDGVAPPKGAYTYTLNTKYNNIAELATPYLALADPKEAEARTFADAVWAIIKDMTPEAQGASDAAGWANLDLGYYLISSEGKNPDGVSTVTAAVSLNTNGQNVHVIPKVDLPTIDKNQSLTADDYGKPALDARIGDTVYYQLKSEVPDRYNYTSYTFTVKDTMSAGLTFNEDVKVFIDGVEYEEWDYAVSPAPETFHIVFRPVPFVAATVVTGKEIVITYTATLNENALIRAANTNTVYLEYSNNPYPDSEGDYSTGETPPITVEVFTYDFRIFKHDEADDGLAGAWFVLKGNVVGAGEDDAAPGTVIPVVQVIATSTDDHPSWVAAWDDYNVYRPALEGETAEEMQSPDSGLILVIGLEPGKYWLEETQEPAGYNKLTGDVDAQVVKAAIATVDVLNSSGSLLPGVGGIGRTIFIIVGLSTMAGAVVLLVVRRKLSKAM